MVADAVLPVFLLLVSGWALRRINIVDAAFWPATERLNYYVFFPCLLVRSLSTADFNITTLVPMGLAMVSATVVLAAATFVTRPLVSSGAAFTSLFQGTIRINLYIGIALTSKLYGSPGLAVSAVALAAVPVLVNALCVIVLVRYGSADTSGVAFLLRSVAANPLIVATIIGLTVKGTGIKIPFIVLTMLDLLGQPTLLLGLLVAGAGLQWIWDGRSLATIAATSLLKLALLPAATALFCQLFRVDALSTAVAVLFSGLPTATAGYILARQMGGDAPLMANIITVQTALAIITLPILVVSVG